MPQNNDQERSEKPTAKKLEKAKEEGNVAKSTEVSSVFILVMSLGVFMVGGSWMISGLSTFMSGIFENAGTLNLDQESLQSFAAFVFEKIFTILMPLMLSIIVAGLLSNIIQTGFMLNSKTFTPKLSKLNPISGLKKIVSLKSFAEVVKAIFKLIFVGTIAYFLIRNEMDKFPALMQMSVIDILSFIGSIAFKICFYVCLALVAISILDFVYQRWQHEKDLMMTKQEVKDENKQSEGDPKVKGRIRQIQIETARRRMMEQVPDADVIVTNPTHIAIALKYDAENMMAPKVIAKGAELIAEKIKKIAKEQGIPIVEHKSLARTLYKIVELGDFIPVNLYRAVAEILAYVYNLKKDKNTA